MKMDFKVKFEFESNKLSNACFFGLYLSESIKILLDIVKEISAAEDFHGTIYFTDKAISINTTKTLEELDREAEMDSMPISPS